MTFAENLRTRARARTTCMKQAGINTSVPSPPALTESASYTPSCQRLTKIHLTMKILLPIVAAMISMSSNICASVPEVQSSDVASVRAEQRAESSFFERMTRINSACEAAIETRGIRSYELPSIDALLSSRVDGRYSPVDIEFCRERPCYSETRMNRDGLATLSRQENLRPYERPDLVARLCAWIDICRSELRERLLEKGSLPRCDCLATERSNTDCLIVQRERERFGRPQRLDQRDCPQDECRLATSTAIRYSERIFRPERRMNEGVLTAGRCAFERVGALRSTRGDDCRSS
jgi:hypothetical protein